MTPPLLTSAPFTPGFTALTTAPPGQEPPVVALARQCCGLLRRALYEWPNATLTTNHFAELNEQSVLVSVPCRLPSRPEYLFELVQATQTGHWRMCYAYASLLRELTPSQQQQAQAFLLAQGSGGRVAPYWE